MVMASSQITWVTLQSQLADLTKQGQDVDEQRLQLSNNENVLYTQESTLSSPSAPDPTTTPMYDSNGNVSSAWNVAMAAYTEEETTYNAQIAQINAQIAPLENTDKQLEINLRNIDTQHQAVQTEMDAVKKVIDKDIDGTFKTFQG